MWELVQECWFLFIKKLVNNNLKENGKLLIAHSDSREFLNNLHSNADERISEDDETERIIWKIKS